MYPQAIFDGRTVFLTYSYDTTSYQQLRLTLFKPTIVTKATEYVFGVTTKKAEKDESVEVFTPRY